MTDPIRVLWLIKGLGPGGAERLLVNHAVGRDRGRFDIEAVYLVPEKSHLVAELEAADVSPTCLGGRRSWDLRWVWRLRSRLVARPVDVVHSHSPLPAAVLRLVVRTLPRQARPGLVYTEHNEWAKHRLATRWANRFTLPLEDAIIAVSDGVKRSMRTRHQSDVVVIHHGVDADRVRAQADREGVRAELGIGDDEIVVGTVANLRWEKGYDLLLDAASTLVRDRADLRFVSVGQGPLERELHAHHEDLDLGDRFLFLGYRPDAVRVMSAFDLFCLPSRHEGLPVVLMEAAALGVPVVASDVGGVGELAVDPPAVLVPADDVDALVDAVVGALSDASARPHVAACPPATARPDGRWIGVIEQLLVEVAGRDA